MPSLLQHNCSIVPPVRIWLLLGSSLGAATLAAQTPPGVQAERTDFAHWLETSPLSPAAAIYHQPLEDELVFGPGGAPGLEELPAATLHRGRFRLRLRTEEGERTVPRNRAVAFGEWHVRVSGNRRHGVVTVFGPLEETHAPGWYPYEPALIVSGTLEPPERRERRRMLGLDGVEIEATLAGTFVGELAGEQIRLIVYSMPEPGSEESELNIFFRDGTNGHGTYPAGRFLALVPLGGRRYRADFNRARNPFCAYNGVFPCPLPWRGNAIESAVEAGELYHSASQETEP